MKHSLIACLMIALPTLALAGPGEPGHSHAHSHAQSHASGDTPFGKPGDPKRKAQTIELRMLESDTAQDAKLGALVGVYKHINDNVKLGVGYNRAAKIIETMEKRGVIGPAVGTRPREVLISQM